VTFRLNGSGRVELYHEYRYRSSTAPADDPALSFTVAQQPDIVLQVHKDAAPEAYVLTYLFDAKYRLQSDDRPGAPDYPPDDAINQMHRYRDAIYYRDRGRRRLEKEVIGAYVLFPATGPVEQIEQAYYYRAVSEINIGAFPLLPGDRFGTRALLKNHLRGLIHPAPSDLLEEAIPQRHLRYETAGAVVLIGTVRPGAQERFLLEEGGLVYHLPTMPRAFALERIRYFAPYFPGKGIRLLYTVKQFRQLSRKAIFSAGHPLYKASPADYLVLYLKPLEPLQDFHPVEHLRSLGYSTLDRLYQAVREGNPVPLIREEKNG
jgi:hypothetical protein